MPWWGWLLVGVGAIAVLIAAAGLALAPRSGRAAKRPAGPQNRRPARAGESPPPLAPLPRPPGPLWAKALLPALALYLAMPIDLIPDFIPVVGYVDDLLLLLLVAWLLLRAVPRDVIEENVRRAGERRGIASRRSTTAAGRGR